MKSKYLKIFKKGNVSIEHYDGCPAFIEMTFAGLTSALYGSDFKAYSISGSYFSNRQGDYLSLISDQQEIGKFVVSEYLKDKSKITGLYKEWLENFKSMWVFYYENFDKDLNNLSDEELLLWSDQIVDLYKNKVSMPGFIDGFMFYADSRLDELLKDFCENNNIPKYQEVYTILSAAVEPSFLNEEEEDLKLIYSKTQVGEEAEKLKTEHLKKYSYIKSSYAGYEEYRSDDLEKQLEEFETHLPETIDFELNKKSKNELKNKYNFTDEITAIAELSELLIKWQDQRKQYTLTFVTLRHKLLEEIVRRINIDLELLRYVCGPQEIKDVLKGKLSSAILEDRKKHSVFLNEDGGVVEVLSGNDAKEFFDEVSALDVDDIKEIKGIVASLGNARGNVKIVKSVDDIKKIESGDILVAGMTRPEHVVGMKKAGAIVTDDGGITCHAAIVSRELKKPCIIGTKISTKVLKDGMKVEVDADNGVVKIL